MQEGISVAYGVILIISMINVFCLSRQKPGRAQQIMQWVVSFSAVMMIGYWIRIKADTIDELMVAQKLIYLSGCFLYYNMLLFLLEYCHLKLPVVAEYMLSIINCCMMAVTVTFDKHHLLYRNYWDEVQDGIYVLVKDYGPIHSLYIIFMLLYFLAMLVVAIWNIYKNKGIRRKQSFLLLMVVVVPTTAYLTEKILELSYDLIPFGVLASELLSLYLMYAEKIYDFNDTVREFVFSSVDAGLIAVDMRGRYKGCNELARQMFPELKNAVIDMNIEQASDKLISMMNGTLQDVPFAEKTYEVSVKDVRYKDNVIGKVIWLMDVTSRREYLKLLQNYQQQLQIEVEQKTKQIKTMQDKMLLSLADIIESRDNNTGGHVKRTSNVVSILIDAIKTDASFSVSESFCESVVRAAPMHDIGKIAIDDRILRKPGRFTAEEFAIMKEHSVNSEEIIKSILKDIEEPEFTQIACNLARHHHERWDGKGYPDHLVGEQIPLEARIMAIADVYDALVSKRCYKEAISFDEAFQIIEDSMGTQFDPNLNQIFLKCRMQLEGYYRNMLHNKQGD